MAEVGIIIVAGGQGRRAGTPVPKQFMPLAGKPVVVHVLERFMEALPGAQIVVALPSGEMRRWERIAAEFGLEGVKTCEGGAARFDSVKNALAALGEYEYIGVHDGARPLVSREVILGALASARRYGSGVPVVEPSDSFRRITPGGSLSVDRKELRAVQTPQFFRADLLRRAYEAQFDEAFTDDASVVERYGAAIALCEGARENIKITGPADMALAQTLLALHKER